MYSAVTYDWMPHPARRSAGSSRSPSGARAAAPHRAGRPSRPAAASAAAARSPEPQPTRRYRWARAIDPYDG